MRDPCAMSRSGVRSETVQQGRVSGWNISLIATPDNVRRTLLDIRGKLVDLGTSQDLRDRVELVMAEILNNIVEHAYINPQDGDIVIRILSGATHFHIEITDHGRPLPGGRIPAPVFPKLQGRIEDLPEGGFGWLIVHTISNVRTYTRTGRQNHLCLEIPFAPSAPPDGQPT